MQHGAGFSASPFELCCESLVDLDGAGLSAHSPHRSSDGGGLIGPQSPHNQASNDDVEQASLHCGSGSDSDMLLME